MTAEYRQYSDGERKNGQFWVTDDHLLSSRSQFQKIDVYSTANGNMLTLDDIVQLTAQDEFFYHEMMVHPALTAHPSPHRVLIIGGGDCGTLRQVIKHGAVSKIVMVEIDQAVIDACEAYFPELTRSLSDTRVELVIGDGFDYLSKQKNSWDVIIIDSTDPHTIAAELFSGDFYKSAYDALADGGILVAQSETPLLVCYEELQRSIFRNLTKHFSIVKFLFFPMPCYPTGWFSAITASKGPDIAACAPEIINDKTSNMHLQYYNGEVHRAAFAMPPFMKERLKSTGHTGSSAD